MKKALRFLLCLQINFSVEVYKSDFLALSIISFFILKMSSRGEVDHSVL